MVVGLDFVGLRLLSWRELVLLMRVVVGLGRFSICEFKLLICLGCGWAGCFCFRICGGVAGRFAGSSFDMFS